MNQGGVFALDRPHGNFNWANPQPHDVPELHPAENIDEKGITYLNESAMLTHSNMTNTVCFFNTRSYWSQGYLADHQFSCTYFPSSGRLQ